MSDNDLIRRGDAMIAMQEHANGETVLGGQTYQSLTLEVALEAINTIPAVQPTVKPLVWENFDAWTYWARSTVGTYHVKERNGVWRATLETRAGGELVYEYTTDGLTPGDFEAALLATQADHEARILSVLDMQPTVSPDVAALVEALDAIEGYNRTLPDENGLYWDRSDLITQEIMSARAALARVKGVTPQTEYERKVAQMKEDFPNGI